MNGIRLQAKMTLAARLVRVRSLDSTRPVVPVMAALLTFTPLTTLEVRSVPLIVFDRMRC
jgi:hypothetical protein